MSELDFYAHLLAQGDVLGVGLGSQPDAWGAALGEDYFEVAERKQLSRDFGLVVAWFARERGKWACDSISVAVHDLPRVTVPAAIEAVYGKFADAVLLDEIEARLTQAGLSVRRAVQPQSAELQRCWVPETGAHLFVVADPEFARSKGKRVGDVWSINHSAGAED